MVGGLVISMMLCVLFPSAFLKDDALWTFQGNVGRVDVAFAGDIQNGCLEVRGDNVRADEPKWLLDNRHNQGKKAEEEYKKCKKDIQNNTEAPRKCQGYFTGNEFSRA